MLLKKLKNCGVRGKIGCWIAAFLDPSVRKQAVGVEGRLSDLLPVLSGVPQGTVLGPILFLIHLLGISDNLSDGTQSSSFADDTRLSRGIGDSNDCDTLQADLDSVYSWAEDSGMVFNAKKFELLRFWPSEEAPVYQYSAPDGSPIEEKSSLRDLGVRVSSDLTFEEQVDTLVQNGSRMAGWALRTFRGRCSHVNDSTVSDSASA